MNIDTNISEVAVEIEGKRYAVAPKTVETARKLAQAARDGQGGELCRVWLKRLKILLGKEAVSRLFPRGKNENLDRMEIIYLGVMDAFDMAAAKAREERDRRVAETVGRMAKSLEPLGEVMRALGGREIIRRDDKK